MMSEQKKDRGIDLSSQQLRLRTYMRSRLHFYKFAPIEQVQENMKNIFAPIVSEHNVQKSN
jgi:hypothetical protein